ncbi:hypothetical protein BU24DRAFT_31575 [Aaosphaeria arxii CBS 175.79]|uniref:Uncharacterized protein n=1 Tax=Aaosphaeria arxii CBS 175.79 TaxID=1450172 RepID=A0A6A5YBA5_9PLEO|nr:uncharacterized protein BU24DRAFT_31575 [Aaosphaeria arxii CBS 175.79]KAF2021884.1 hypothetical protein BU24DRAFT_31575 [Aaosphaeria arxii CBS 175.79]
MRICTVYVRVVLSGSQIGSTKSLLRHSRCRQKVGLPRHNPLPLFVHHGPRSSNGPGISPSCQNPASAALYRLKLERCVWIWLIYGRPSLFAGLFNWVGVSDMVTQSASSQAILPSVQRAINAKATWANNLSLPYAAMCSLSPPRLRKLGDAFLSKPGTDQFRSPGLFCTSPLAVTTTNGFFRSRYARCP